MGQIKSISGTLIDDDFMLSLDELCHLCHQETAWVITLIDEGILKPRGGQPSDWLFDNRDMRHARQVLHLQRDLQVNLAGAAVIIELMDELHQLRRRLNQAEDDITDI